MCGRFVRHSNFNEFTELVAGLTYAGLEPQPHYHVAPSQLCLVASEHADSDKRELVTLKWGLGAELVQGCKGRLPAHQRAQRDGRAKSIALDQQYVVG